MSAGRWLDYRVVDVFTDRAYAGNPLAVVLGADGLSTEAMQAVANEFNLSETTFPIAASSPEAAYRLRIFTATTELPFAGHPSVGSAWVMRSLGTVSDGRIVQECGAGLLPLDLAGDRVTLHGGTPTVGDVVPAAQAAEVVGLDAADLVGDDVRPAGVGLEFRFLHVRQDAVTRAVADPTRLAAVPGGGVSVFSLGDGVAHARVFAGGIGPAEDPATGSAALGLGAWLVACGHAAADGETPYVVEQGIEMGRPSRLECTVVAEGGRAVATRVTGSVVPIAEGRIRQP